MTSEVNDKTKLRIDGVSMHFGGVKALSDVSIEMSQGDILGLIGPNGSGKTTLLNIIAGLLPPTAGDVLMGDRRISDLSSDAVARLGISRTFQNIRVFKDLTLTENVEVAAGVQHRAREARILSAKIIHDLGLERWTDSLARTLPYGTQRRLEIGRALALEPSILLLDEPAAGLNDTESEALLHVIESVRETHGCGILIIDHDMRLMMRLCQRIVVLNEGHKIADGPPDEVRSDPEVIEAYLG